MARHTDFDIPVTVAGVKFRNPFYVSSGPTTMTVEQLERIEATGWGGASLKLTIDPEPYINRYPRYGYYPSQGYLTFTAERRLDLPQLLKLIEQGRKRAPHVVLFSNITYSGEAGVDGWVNMARKCEEAGVHINELNMCCPNMSFNVEVSGGDTTGPQTGASLGCNATRIAEIVMAIKQETSIPLFVKLSPEGGQQPAVAKAALEAGADAVGGSANRVGIPPIDINNPTKSMYDLQEEIGMACMNGEWLRPLALRDVYMMRRDCGPEVMLTGTGGITHWQDAVEMIMCGADLIGICAATLIHGFGFMPEFIDGFRKFMAEKGYRVPRDMRDILVSAVTAAPDLTIYPGHARKKAAALVAPCVDACPNSVPAQGYVRKVAEEEFEEAYQLIMSRSPLQSICGKVCDRPCEVACTRGFMDEPIMIREIKRFVLDMAEREGWQPRVLSDRVKTRSQAVAVIGSGPAGLACAYDLARVGYGVTVFEASEKLGGMLTACIPAFRLAENDVDKEIHVLRDLGVEFKTGQALGREVTIDGLKADGFAACFIGIGAQSGVKLGVPGEELPGCTTAVDFLRTVAAGGRPEPGQRVGVIGGGFTAIDAARTAVRLGAGEVFLLYRRTRDEMPADAEEIALAEEEGVRIMYLVAPLEVTGADKVESLLMLNYVLGEEDASERRRPVEVPGTEFTLRVDSIISAVSQDVACDGMQRLDLTERGTIGVDGDSGATSLDGVFAGGDCARGPGNVISAVADGKRAAASIDKLLAGDEAVLDYASEKTVVLQDSVLERIETRARAFRPILAVRDAHERVGDFDEYTPLLTEEQAVAEASRCLACGCGAGCETCERICKVFAWAMTADGSVVLDEEKCVGCGMCIQRCPNRNIEMIQTGTENLLR